MICKDAKWVWINTCPEKNEYAFFEGEFEYCSGTAVFSIAAETDYILKINDTVAGFGQFAGYPFEKYCDEIDISSFCIKGKNTFYITVRYEGTDSATHIDDGAGVIFSLDTDGKNIFCSNEKIRCGYDGGYIQHNPRDITVQLGLASDMTAFGENIYTSCIEVEKTYNIKKRPVKKAEVLPFVPAKHIGSGIYDLGREEAGYLKVCISAKKACKVKIAYGEHIADGSVRYLIGKRNFSLDFEALQGENEFLQLFVRVAARYLQVVESEDVQILSIGLVPTLYPLTEKPFSLPQMEKSIYDTSVRTLRLCMDTHYQDCPWREQALYALDSRNQMLCGYYAFEQTEFQRANIVFMKNGLRSDGILELTYPARNTRAIPFFSLMYIVAVYEYVKHTGDKTIIDETFDTMLTIVQTFTKRIGEKNLITEFDSSYWNFYEWTEYSDGKKELPREHLILNCGYVYALLHFEKICKIKGVEFNFDISSVKAAIEKEFFNDKNGLYSLYTDKEVYSQVGNAFALLIGLGNKTTLATVKSCEGLIPATLSMLTFIYDAIIVADKDAREYIFTDIKEKYGYMLDQGATSFWETIEGESAFKNAGSLCHGWSAIPVYYYNLLW